MATAPFPPLRRFALIASAGLLFLLTALPTSAQVTLRLVDPVLLVDGDRVVVNGGPIQQRPFAFFTLDVPGHGTYVVADRPFAGARRAGQFNGTSLAFTVEGRSVRLRTGEPILDQWDPVYAFVRLDPSGVERQDGMALVSLTLPSSRPAPLPTTGPAPPEPVRTADLGRETEAVVAARRERQRLAQEIEEAQRERETLATQNAGLSGEIARLRHELARLDESGTPLTRERLRLQTEIARLEADRVQAAREQARLANTRQRLQVETSTLTQDLTTYTRQVEAYESERARLIRERDRLSQGLTGTRRETEALTAALSTLETDHARLVQERARLATERTRISAETESLRRGIRTLNGETDRLATERDRLAAEQARLIDRRDQLLNEQAALRDQLQTLQTTTATLAQETARLRTRRQTAETEQARLVQERDRLRTVLAQEGNGDLADEIATLAATRDRLQREAETFRTDIAALDEERTVLAEERAERVRALEALRAEPDPAPPPRTAAQTPTRTVDTELVARLTTQRDEAAAERDEYAVGMAGLRREIDQLRTHAQGLETEVNRLTVELQRLYDDRQQLARERDALHLEAERLRTARTPSGDEASLPRPSVAPVLPPQDGSSVRLRDFNWGQLQNTETIRQLLIDAEYPTQAVMTRAQGEVVVFFVTDDTGRVVETAVAEPLGNGLDAVAERIVRTMRFVPPTVEGTPTVLRSQVTVVFKR